MPTTRSPRTGCIASVTMPAGLVKLIATPPGRARPPSRRAWSWPGRSAARSRAARAGRLLPEDAEPEGDALVDDAALELADPDRAEDEVGAVDRVVEDVVVRNGSRSACSAASPSSTGRCGPAASSSTSCSTISSRPSRSGFVEQRSVHERDPEPSATDDRELHAIVTSTPKRSAARPRAGGTGRVGDDRVERARVGHPHYPRHRELRASASSATVSAAAIMRA